MVQLLVSGENNPLVQKWMGILVLHSEGNKFD